MVDYVGLADVAIGFFFVVLALVLLARYRKASQRLSESAELNHDLWRAMEARFKKQDARIIDALARVEVLQARVLSPPPSTPFQPVMTRDVMPMQQVTQPRPSPMPKPAARAGTGLGETESKIVALLAQGAKSPIDIKEALGLSREHTARMMKALFDKGLVTRDATAKPFVYQLTEKGRDHLSAG